ncbi:helix-turn-helix transcriptional regulator [Micromonospora nigra]|uniref:helix-turn-helix transcriptional regulator n=1 Tax=Micromonospora nigra TaxID=145857 RepID=UPI001112D59E|nr:LuxR family transcriptional regulator [Micromonospora nigra]
MDLQAQIDAVAVMRSELSSGRSVLLTGEAGSGRTAVLEQLRGEMTDSGRSVVLVRGADAVAELPLVAFAEVIADHGIVGAAPLTIYTNLPVRVRSRGTIVLVDDADALDRASAVLLGQLARAGTLVAVAVTSPDDLPKSVLDEVTHGRWGRVDLAPLGSDDVLRVAAELVGDELAARSAAMLVSLAEGHLSTVVEQVAAAGVLGHGPAGIELGDPVATPALRRRAEEATRGVGPEAYAALERLALAPALPVGLFPGPVVADLVAVGLVAVEGTSIRQTRPLVGLALRSRWSTSERAERQGQLADALGGWPAWSGTSLLMAVRAGRRISDDLLLDAADVALAAARNQEVQEFLDALRTSSPRERLLRGAVAAAEGETATAEQFLREIDLAAVSDSLRVRIGQEWGLALAVRGGDPQRAVRQVTAVLSTISNSVVGRVLETDLVKWRLMAGERAADVEVSPTSDDPRVRLNEAVIGAMLASLGRTAPEVLAYVDAGRALLSEIDEVPGSIPDLLTLSEYLGVAFDGRVAEAERLASRHRDRAAREADPSLGMWEFAAAELALHRGDLTQAEALARRATRHLAWRDFTGLQSAAVALMAAVNARRGRLGAAEDLIGDITDAHTADVKVALHVARTRAERALRSRRRTEAADLLSDAGRTALAHAHLHLALMALDEAFMLDPADDRARAVIDQRGLSPLAAVLARRVEAVLGGTATELALSVDELDEMGLVGRAAHAAHLVARTHSRAGGLATAQKWRSRAILLTTRCGTAWPPARDGGALSPRELDIARRAARRERSREIGAELGLSARTVENHLARIYRKLGIAGRDGLADEMLGENFA